MKRTLRTTRIILGLLLGLALWNAEPHLQAATRTVTNTDDSGAGSLRDTIAEAVSGDTIDFSLSSCPCTITLTSGTLVINKNLTIQGPGAHLLAVSGGGSSWVFYIGSGTVTLDGLTIRDGHNVAGGGILNNDTLTVINSMVSNNSTAFNGGGIYNVGTLTVTSSTVSDNSAGLSAGGIFNNGGTLTVTNSTVSYNSAAGAGGGISSHSAATLNNTIVAGNVGGTMPNDIVGSVTAGSHNLIGVDVTTVLEPLASNGGPTQTHKLLAGSLAVNAGDNALAVDGDNNFLQYDQRGPGFPRISGGTVDIGAFELGQAYNFSGFFPPVANPLTVNLAKAGSAIPVKFSLGGYQGLDILMSGYPASQPMGCMDMPSDPVEETVTAGASSLSYDPVTDQYTYVWKTNRAWKDSCRQLVIQLNDGSTHEAYFQFK